MSFPLKARKLDRRLELTGHGSALLLLRATGTGEARVASDRRGQLGRRQSRRAPSFGGARFPIIALLAWAFFVFAVPLARAAAQRGRRVRFPARLLHDGAGLADRSHHHCGPVGAPAGPIEASATSSRRATPSARCEPPPPSRVTASLAGRVAATVTASQPDSAAEPRRCGTGATRDISSSGSQRRRSLALLARRAYRARGRSCAACARRRCHLGAVLSGLVRRRLRVGS